MCINCVLHSIEIRFRRRHNEITAVELKRLWVSSGCGPLVAVNLKRLRTSNGLGVKWQQFYVPATLEWLRTSSLQSSIGRGSQKAGDLE